jgi:hypothetical protein
VTQEAAHFRRTCRAQPSCQSLTLTNLICSIYLSHHWQASSSLPTEVRRCFIFLAREWNEYGDDCPRSPTQEIAIVSEASINRSCPRERLRPPGTMTHLEMHQRNSAKFCHAPPLLIPRHWHACLPLHPTARHRVVSYSLWTLQRALRCRPSAVPPAVACPHTGMSCCCLYRHLQSFWHDDPHP